MSTIVVPNVQSQQPYRKYTRRYASKPNRIPYDEWVAKYGKKKASRSSSSSSSNNSNRAYNYRAKGTAKYGGKVSSTLGGILGGAIGTAVGGPAGAAMGMALGAGAGGLFHQVTGLGAYTVKKNAVLRPDEVPLFRPSNDGSVVVAYREYIQDITSSATPGAFSINTFEINPGLSSSFPWLSNIAQNYDEWKPLGILYEYKTMSSDALNSTNTALGQVIMATEFNPLNAPFANKQQMEQSLFSGSAKPSVSLVHPIECAPSQTRPLFNVRSDATVAGDIRLYDIGKFSIATNGFQGTSVNCGELWVTYCIKFMKPRLGQNASVFDHYQFTTGVDTTHYLGNPIGTLIGQSDFGTTITNTTVTIPSSYTGNVLLIWDVQGDAGVWVDPLMTPSAGASALPLMLNDAQYRIQSSYLAAQQRLKTIAFVSCVNGGLITFSSGTLPTNSTQGDLFVIGLPLGLLL